VPKDVTDTESVALLARMELESEAFSYWPAVPN